MYLKVVNFTNFSQIESACIQILEQQPRQEITIMQTRQKKERCQPLKKFHLKTSERVNKAYENLNSALVASALTRLIMLTNLRRNGGRIIHFS